MKELFKAIWGYVWRVFMTGILGWMFVSYLKDLEDPERWWN